MGFQCCQFRTLSRESSRTRVQYSYERMRCVRIQYASSEGGGGKTSHDVVHGRHYELGVTFISVDSNETEASLRPDFDFSVISWWPSECGQRWTYSPLSILTKLTYSYSHK
jgi:hypothetical protein